MDNDGLTKFDYLGLYELITEEKWCDDCYEFYMMYKSDPYKIRTTRTYQSMKWVELFSYTWKVKVRKGLFLSCRLAKQVRREKKTLTVKECYKTQEWYLKVCKGEDPIVIQSTTETCGPESEELTIPGSEVTHNRDRLVCRPTSASAGGVAVSGPPVIDHTFGDDEAVNIDDLIKEVIKNL